jgi:aspartyl-tRNA(Asn)/glutamyl-tRNA(Gln) amidotransferase subunit C
MEQLKEVDVEGVEPTAHITGLENIAREDKAGDFGNIAGIVKLFPEEKDGYDKVKSIL